MERFICIHHRLVFLLQLSAKRSSSSSELNIMNERKITETKTNGNYFAALTSSHWTALSCRALSGITRSQTAAISSDGLPAAAARFLCGRTFNPLNAELNPICYLLALLGAHHFLHVSRIRVKSLTLRLLMSYIQGVPGGMCQTSGGCSLC